MTKQDSLIITFLRFPLIIGIVFSHCIIISYEQALENGLLFLGNTEFIVSNIICPSFVPLFFIFSGYLFFANITRFTFKSYAKNLKEGYTRY